MASRRAAPQAPRARRGGGGGPGPSGERSGSDLGARLLAAIPAIAFALVIVISGGIVFTLGVMALGFICLHELFGMYERMSPVRLAGFLGLAGMLLAANYGGQHQVLLAAAFFTPVLFLLTLAQRRHSVAGMAITMLGVWWIGYAFASAVLLRHLPHGEGIVIDVLVGTFLGDTGAYLGGRMLGTRKLAPRISPNKTVEGLFVGMVCAVIGVWLAGRYQDWLPSGHALVLGLGVALIAPLGDLFESFIKREAGTKDTGRTFGAHGGALDRLDAVMFTAIVGYYIWWAYV
jgi:phosphatidate cytidylyltransferase